MDVLEAAVAAVRSGRRAALVTVIAVRGSTPRNPGSRMLVRDDGSTVGTIGGGTFEHRVTAVALEALATGRPARYDAHLTRDLGMCCGGEMSVYVEPLMPREPLVVYGAGHVAHALAPIASALGFEVTVVDDRDDLNTAERFPDAERVVSDAAEHARGLGSDPARYVLIVTHDHQLDQQLCEVLLPLDQRWVGMIGSRAKVAKFFVRLRAAGMDEALFAKLCAPVGLAIGAETPAEIAISIAGELVRVRRAVEGPSEPLSQAPIPARGGDGRARS
ncbi:MAG: xanthine dehydrogenase accessory protein XdhC [Myxococcota bacterium]